MPKTATVPQEPEIILSSLSPGPAQKRLALAVVVAISGIFVLITAGPLSSIPAMRLDAFVPAYATALFVCDSITAVLLFAQFSILRSRAILVIASGYLFTALILIPWVLAFPGVFVPQRGLMGGLQSTSWLYFLQHAGFPLFVIGYALSKDGNPDERLWHGTLRAGIAQSVALTAALVSVVAFICIAGEAQLPRVVDDSVHLSPTWPYVGAPVALLSVCALAVLWMRRRSMLDLWLMVVMFLYAIEIPLSYYPTPIRFSIGWYSVRVIGFISGSLVLVVLLYEIETLYARLVGSLLAQRREREARLMTGGTVAATIAHEIRQPLTAIVTSADAGLRFLDRPAPNLDKAREALKWIVADGHRAEALVESIRTTFKSSAGSTTSLDVNELIREALALERSDLQKHRIIVQSEPSTRLQEVRGNRVQLRQVLLNLIMNAVDAMAANEEPRVLHVACKAGEGDGIAITVADTGTGIKSEDVDRIFNPLFTTKSDGMGMGLSICRAIVESHGGRLSYAPNTPRGAVFQFTLHAIESTSAPA